MPFPPAPSQIPSPLNPPFGEPRLLLFRRAAVRRCFGVSAEALPPVDRLVALLLCRPTVSAQGGTPAQTRWPLPMVPIMLNFRFLPASRPSQILDNAGFVTE
jgi:hypothetical protein